VPEAKRFTKLQELVREMRVSEAMMRDVVTVGRATSMRELGEILRTRRISGTPVVEDGRVLGIISIEDFIKWLGKGPDDVPICEHMTRDVAVIGSDEPLISAVCRLEDSGFGRLPVVESGSGELVGIITKGSVIEGLLKKLEIDYHQEEAQRYTGKWLFDDVLADRAGLNLEYQVPGGDVKNAGSCSSRLRKTLTRLGVHPQALRRVAIATYEAEMNAAIHADGGEISANVAPHEVVIVVQDKGPGIEDVEEAMRPGFSTASEWVRELGFGAGMGLSNIKNCSDEMKLTSKPGVGTRLEARFVMEGSTT
jgi:CBS domain-containing protein/anti-sigma regulatory factor (Ser/Thr protein kinase)